MSAEKKDKAIRILGEIKNNPSQALLIHYSRQNLNDNDQGISTPRIIAIMVKSIDGTTTYTFAINHEAEKAKVIPENITDYYDLLEERLLRGFNTFVKNHTGHKWLHWDMNDVHFSFEAIEHRYKVLIDQDGKDYIEVPFQNRINLNGLMKDIYSSNYEKDPQLDNLMKTNNKGRYKDGFLTLPDEALAFKQLDFPKILESLRCKINFLLDVIDKAVSKTLKVGKRNTTNRLRSFITHPITATISLVLTLLSIILKLFGAFGK
ncbi:MAG: hypothetical protein WDO71_08275 [Bacteroidota bacterium]